MIKPSVFFTKPFSLLKNKYFRNLMIVILLVFATLCMFCFDTGNGWRLYVFTFLESNVIMDLMSWLGIERINITYTAWLIFLSLAVVITIFCASSYLSTPIIMSKVNKSSGKFAKEESAKKFYGAIYYTVVAILCVAVIFVFYFAGLYAGFGKGESSVFLNLLKALLVGVCFFAAIPIIIGVAYYVLNAVIFVVGFICAFLYNVFMMGTRPFMDKKADKMGNTIVNNAAAAPVEVVVKTENAKEENGEEVKELFPSLIEIDNKGEEKTEEITELSLDEFVRRFQSYAASKHIYYELPLLRSYLAGMASSKMVILKGLSGTGKSMLPRMFTEFTQSNANFSPVQATWRDKTDLLGYYSEFSKTFKTTDFLRDLYKASYNDKVNTMVLDEMNLSRVEYYFADFLSVLEYPSSDWKIRVYDPMGGEHIPAKLTGGYVTIPENTWFIGTANTDDSTFTITDKVYDRAIIIDFSEKIKPIETDYPSDVVAVTAEQLQKLFDEAIANEEYRLSEEEENKFLSVCDFLKDSFDIRFGNRIMVQIENFVPVYVALGGSKEEALDFMLARKIVSKLEGLYEDYLRDELIKLTKLLNTTYGKGVFTETEAIIAKIMKRLG